MREIHIGTSGWSYPSGPGRWTGILYPPGMRDELGFYTTLFDTVEVNSSFYRPLTGAMTASWLHRTPGEFFFSVKLWQRFTHPRMYAAKTGQAQPVSRGDVDLFKRGLQPLHAAGRLAALLAQFPPSFKRDDQGAKETLLDTIRMFDEYPLVVELRHRSWSDDPETARLLREANVSWVEIDEPKFSTSVAGDVPATSDLAYFRFHGRNAAQWWSGLRDGEGAGKEEFPGRRYDYLYSEQELSQLGEKVRSRAETAARVLVYFNNHPYGQAPVNALQLKRLLGQETALLPPQLLARFPQLGGPTQGGLEIGD